VLKVAYIAYAAFPGLCLAREAYTVVKYIHVYGWIVYHSIPYNHVERQAMPGSLVSSGILCDNITNIIEQAIMIGEPGKDVSWLSLLGAYARKLVKISKIYEKEFLCSDGCDGDTRLDSGWPCVQYVSA
jgi:hypothetical protein